MSAKVDLIRREYDPHGKLHGRKPALLITQALPFYRKNLGLVHRVRDGRIHLRDDGSYSHTHVGFWCGNTGFVGAFQPDRYGRGTRNPGLLYADPPEHAVHCATCEGRATGAGLNGARAICGRTVLYQPKV